MCSSNAEQHKPDTMYSQAPQWRQTPGNYTVAHRGSHKTAKNNPYLIMCSITRFQHKQAASRAPHISWLLFANHPRVGRIYLDQSASSSLWSYCLKFKCNCVTMHRGGREFRVSRKLNKYNNNKKRSGRWPVGRTEHTCCLATKIRL